MKMTKCGPTGSAYENANAGFSYFQFGIGGWVRRVERPKRA
jgi:hypothetical protein